MLGASVTFSGFTNLSDTAKGVGLALCSTFLFTLVGVLVRLLSDSLDLFQILLFRQLVFVTLLLPAIVSLLEQPMLFTENQLTKEKWVTILKNSGMNEEDMSNWHRQFETAEPDAHQAFLESLHIDAEEIQVIRRKSQAS